MRSRFFFASIVGVCLTLGAGRLVAQVGSEPTPHQDPTGNTGALKSQVETGGSYDARTGNATRMVPDLKVPGALGDYGLDFIRYWNSLPPGDAPRMPAAMPFADFGVSGWTHSWAWSALEEHEYPEEIPGSNNHNNLWKTSITITFPDGHTTKYQILRLDHGVNGIPGDPRHGPPYYIPGEINWPQPAGGVKDYLCNMAQDGSTFWLHRADGSSVLFGGGPDGYVAYEIYDPHGFKTTLTYNTSWQLERVEQEGGRWLTLSWGYAIGGGVAPVIKKVETGGNAGYQSVNYTYAVTGGVLTLATVDYSEGADAVYTYEGHLLKAAVDPRFPGAMKKIRYTYRGERCYPWQKPANDPPNAHFFYFYAQPEAVTSERSFKTNALVSGLDIFCFNGTRRDYNGLGGARMFYYGRSAMWPDSGAFGHELAKVTDFYADANPDGAPARRQSNLNGNPYQIWDGRDNRTQLAYGDSSGEPSQIKHLTDGNKTFLYNRIDPEGSAAVDPTRIHNPHSRWLFSQTDERGLKTIYRRDERRRVKEIIHPWNTGTEYFTYNNMNQVLTHTLTSGAVQTYVYDALNRLEREYNSVEGEGAAKIYTYDELGRVRTVSDCRSRAAGKDFSTRMTYNGRHQVTQVEYAGMSNGTNPKVQYGYDSTGNCTSITDELGQTSTYSYDDYRRCVSYTEPLNAPGWDGGGTVANRTWTWIYDRVIDGMPQGDSSVHTSKEWRVQIEPAFNRYGDRKMTARTFDVNNRIKREQTGWIQPAGDVNPNNPWYWTAEGETHHFTYDENGQKSTFTDPMGRVTSYEYDTRNRLWKTHETINSVPRTTETLYDGTGNKVQVTFPDGKTQRWEGHDPFGQPARFFDERNNVTDLFYRWGPMKKLASVITHRHKDGGGMEDQLTQFWHDGTGRLTETIFPDTTYEQSTYECGQLKTWRTRKAQVKTITSYDPRGRELTDSWSDGTPGTTRLWDAANRLTQISNMFSKIEYSYDAAGQVAFEWNTITGSVGVLGKSAKAQTKYYRYPNGEVSRLQYHNGVWTQREYTARGQLKTVSDTLGGGELQPTVNYSYHLDGKVDYQSYGNGVLASDLTYDPRGFISNVVHQRGSTNLMQRNYHRDERDRITSWQKGNNVGVNPRENGRGDRYVYDEEGQLTHAWYNAVDPHGTATGWERKDYFQYDALGNRHGWNDVANRGPMLIQRRDNGLNQYHSWENNHPIPDPLHWGTETHYDDNFPAPNPPPPNYRWVFPGNGVMMADGYIVASYNALNQPVAIGSMFYAATGNYVWFGYDPLGRCVKRWVGPVGAGGTVPPANTNPATYLYYDGWNLVQEGTAAHLPARTYVHGGRMDEIVASKNYATSQRAYHQYDARGHCTLLTDPSGQILEQYEYDAFGQPYFYQANGNPMLVSGSPGSAFGNRFLFTGREWLSDLRLYDYRHRMYQPELGRFLQPDPKQFEAGDYNLYRYCHNDPINKTDPTGENWLDNVQMALDVAGFIPVVGEVADLGSGLISAGRGDWVGAGMSLGAMIPTGGQVLGAAKIARHGAAAVKRAENMAKGIPASQLGPSGKPYRHTVEKSTEKKALEAARQAGGQKPDKHTQDKGQGPHYHAVDKDGKKLEGKDNIHYKKRGED